LYAHAIADFVQLFSALSETLHSQLRQVTNEKHEMTEEAHRLLKTIRQMEASLEDNKPNPNYEDHDDKAITFPLTRCLKDLKERYNSVSKMHKERFEQVRKLAEALESYASHLESSFVKIKLPPTAPNATVSPSFDISPSYVTKLDNEFTRVYEEYTRRIDTVKIICQDIIQLWAELGTPQAQTDSAIVQCHRDAPEQLGLHKDDLAQLKAKKERLVEEKRGRERRLGQLRTTIEELWDRLGVEERERKQFLTSNRGCGLRTINEYEDELARLNELKRQNLHLFVEEARVQLQELWDALYFSEEEMLDFTPAFSDVCSDALLAAHESEIARLEALKEQRLPILQKIDRHRELIQERDELQQSSQDATRLMARGNKGERRDPGKLLREEKMRKRIAKELPKVETVRSRLSETRTQLTYHRICESLLKAGKMNTDVLSWSTATDTLTNSTLLHRKQSHHLAQRHPPTAACLPSPQLSAGHHKRLAVPERFAGERHPADQRLLSRTLDKAYPPQACRVAPLYRLSVHHNLVLQYRRHLLKRALPRFLLVRE
jgi:protein regulator of cytokinesis 1